VTVPELLHLGYLENRTNGNPSPTAPE